MANEYVWVVDASAGFDGATEDEMARFCERAEAYLTEHEGDDLEIYVRMPRRGEAPATYVRKADGSLQILGFSTEVPEEVAALTNRAWQHAMETWA